MVSEQTSEMLIFLISDLTVTNFLSSNIAYYKKCSKVLEYVFYT